MYEPSDEVKRYAKRINSDPAFKAVLEALIEQSTHEFQSTGPTEEHNRTNAWWLYNSTCYIGGLIATWASEVPD